MDPEIATLSRNARRGLQLSPGSICTACGTARHLKRRPDGRVLCYACRRKERGAGPTERDHVAGEANLGGLVVVLRQNDHRTVTDLRLQMGIDTWPEAAGDPLLSLAHVLAGLASLLFLYGSWLVELAADLRGRLGPGTWEGAPLAPVVA